MNPGPLGTSRALHRPPPLARDRGLGRADPDRRRRGRQALEPLVPELLDPGQVGLRGEPADAEGVRRRRAPAERRRLPHDRRRDQERRDQSRRCSARRRRCRARSPARTSRRTTSMYVSHDRHTAFLEVYPPGKAKFDTKSGAKQMRAAAAAGPAGRDHGERDRPRSARGGVLARRRRQLERAARGADRRPRRARDPAVRVRDAAGRADADRRRHGGDPEHVHARLGA